MTNPDDLNPDRVRAVIADAWSRLSPEDRAERIAFDIEHNVAGVTMKPASDSVEFVRGGQTLAVASLDVLCGDGPLPAGEFVHDTSDMDADIEKLLTNDGDDDAR